MVPNLASLSRNLSDKTEVLRYELNRGIQAIRYGARESGLLDMRETWGVAGTVGLSAGIIDANRAKYYSDRFARFVEAEAERPNAIALLDNRLATIAISENAQAFNLERRRIANEIAEGFELVEIWDAMMDACPVCWGLNGTEAIVGYGFPGGEEPGGVHARCRCTSHFERRRYH